MEGNTFANRLIQARKKANMTQTEVAKELNITQTTLSKYETGRLEPNIELLTKIINLYEINANWLFGTGMKQ